LTALLPAFFASAALFLAAPAFPLPAQAQAQEPAQEPAQAQEQNLEQAQDRRQAEEQALKQQLAATLEPVFRNQAPLKESEIPAAVEAIVMLNSTSYQGSGGEGVEEIAEKHDLKPGRVIYAHAKCTMGAVILKTGEVSDEAVEEAMGTRLARPTPAELETIRPHLDAIWAAMFPGDQPPPAPTDGLFRRQPPLGESDMPAALEAVRQLAAPSAEGLEGKILEEIAAAHGTTPERVAFARAKCLAGAAEIKAGELPDAEAEAAMGSRLASPSPEELEIVRAHLDEIAAALQPPAE
jgi:hypothetical protein